jgi:2-polyprenyl-6-methoxyphenol hydroxylase-like FAD-dependent oxidoreductase
MTSERAEISGPGHAVVIGASIAGLLAARALSDAFSRVTVFDRDILPDGPDTRRGAPQGRQAHALLARGADALDQLFPGFVTEMIASGAVAGDPQRDFYWYLDGHRLRPAPSGLTNIALTRPLIESLIRTRTAALDGVRIVGSRVVTGLVTDQGRVTGVRVSGGDAGTEESVPADLVVDAAGRGSRAHVWLRELGYPDPPASGVRTDVVYVSRHYRREPHHLDGRIGAAIVGFPGLPRGAAVIRQEDDQFVVLLCGMLGEDPPTDDEGMLAFAESLPATDVAEVLRSAKPLDDPAKMRYPASQWHHYEKLARHPEGFLVTGDALCNFNPVYGQGMTIAALEALTLKRLLADGPVDLPRRFYAATAKFLSQAWSVSTGADLRFPEVEGKRTPVDGLVNRYLDRYRIAASADPVLGTAFLRVTNMIDPPIRLMAGRHILRVFRSAKKARPGSDRGDRAARPAPP